MPFALGGILLLLKAIDRNKLILFFVGGLLLGITFIIKQHAVSFCLFAPLFFTSKNLTARPVDYKRLISGNMVLFAGLALPFLITCVILYTAGVFSEFWFWTFTYAREYVAQRDITEILPTFLYNITNVIDYWWLLWVFSAVGFTAIFWEEKIKSNLLFLISFSLFSFLTVCPGFYFRPHYFVTFLPVAAMFAGIALSASLKWIAENTRIPIIKIIPVIAVTVAFIFPVVKLGDFFFKIAPLEASRILYPQSIFPESITIAEYIKSNTNRDDRIAVIGSEPQIYFYADRKSAARYVYVYALTERHSFASQMQREMIREIESAQPKYILYVDEPSSWTIDLEADLSILEWSEKYLSRDYSIEGIMLYNVFNNKYDIYWDKEAEKMIANKTFKVFVLKRNI